MAMPDTWRADAACWDCLPKGELTAALEAASSVTAFSMAGRKEFLKACGKLKKDELAAKVEAAYAGAHCLLDLFIATTGIQAAPAEAARRAELVA